MTESVTISLERYEAMKQEINLHKKHAEALTETLSAERAEFDEMFDIYKELDGEVRLKFNTEKCYEIFKNRIAESEYATTHEIKKGFLTKCDYVDTFHYCYSAKPKLEEKTQEDEQ